jgi:hypothetical protein
VTAAITSREALDSLERSFSSKAGYLLVREIALGARDGRRADAIALQLYESRGIHLHGFEVKVSRSDWLQELRDAAKADELVRSCQYFSVVAAAGIVDPAELPEGWGLFEVRGATRQLHRVVAAARRDDPEPLSLVGNARLLRRMIEALRAPGEAVRRDLLEAEYQRGLADGRRHVDHDRYERDEHRKLEAVVRAFQRSSGIDLRAWLGEERAERLGEAARQVLEQPRIREQLQAQLRRMAGELERAAMELEPGGAAAAAGPSFDEMIAVAGGRR